ncbi:hypothetical protein IKQ21_03015 [bacterium]|nr:hypothetical protein [bacterium]
MQVQKIQNNYNPNFSARVFYIDKNNLLSKGMKDAFTKMCKDLGKSTDEIYLTVEKGGKKSGEIEKDIFNGFIKQEKRKTTFKEELNVWANREYSMPRNLTNIYIDYIMPAFKKL